MSKFKHYDLDLVTPGFQDELTDKIIELEYLRKQTHLSGSTHPKIFFQLKYLFHTFESLGSARIEGNRTTITEYIENTIEKPVKYSEKIIEIKNMEKALDFIDKNINDYPINKLFVTEIHRIVVENLSVEQEGDRTPGQWRQKNVEIARSNHLPPDYSAVGGYMNELFDFIKRQDSPKYDLIKTAIAHHRFVWIHPFSNGNGRTVRLFTYAMLLKLGFDISIGQRIINPTAVFCNDRDTYYHNLSVADSGKREDVLAWCDYVLSGLKDEIKKIDKLLDYEFLRKEILVPAINHALKREVITEDESKILKLSLVKQVFRNSDVRELFPSKLSQDIARRLRELKEKKMIEPINKNARKYVISFTNNYLLRSVVSIFEEKGFLPSLG